jgi:hypothetical protein
MAQGEAPKLVLAGELCKFRPARRIRIENAIAISRANDGHLGRPKLLDLNYLGRS